MPFFFRYIFVYSILLSIPVSYADPALDAGSIQRDIQRLNQPNLPPSTSIETSSTPIETGSTKIQVNAFQFVGANLISEANLQAAVQSKIGKLHGFNDLNKIAHEISLLYRSKGWLAKVYLPPQDIQNGLVTIEINEAKLGEISVNTNKEARLNSDYASRMLAQSQKNGAPLDIKLLERAMLLINDTPGFAGQASLSAGDQLGETDITLNLQDKPIFQGQVWGDNYGSRLLGKARLNGQVYFNNLTGYGDQLNLLVIASRGLGYVQSGYEVPIGTAGTRLNVGGSVSNYSVHGGGLSNLDAQGEAYGVRIGLKHPIIRSRASNLGFYSTIERLNFINEVLGLEVSDKQYQTLTVGLKADKSDNFGLGGVFWGGLSITAGKLDLKNQDDFTADSITAETNGHYHKFNFYLGRQQALSENLSAKALFSGQISDSNLGGFEKFSLGGPVGVKGFTSGEAAADQGWMLNLESKYAFTPNINASLLADTGGVCQFKNRWAGWNAGNPQLKNCYQLASIGAGVNYTNQLFDARLSYARRITANHGVDNFGNDIEGENAKHQVWLLISTFF